MNSYALTDTTVICLAKERLYELLRERSDIGFRMLNCMAERLYFKYFMVQNNSLKSPSEKIWMLLNYLKSYSLVKKPFSYEVFFTRQQLASFIGLSVETVIRTVKNLEKKGVVKIVNGKIYI